MVTWSFDHLEFRLESARGAVMLTPKAASVLHLLTKRQGELVTKQEILEHVWQGVAVTPNLVREYIFDLRRALDDDAEEPRYIETVRGRGFRLLGGVSLCGPKGRAGAARLPRIQVMAPEVLGDAGVADRLVLPLQQDIRTELAFYSDLEVIGWPGHGEDQAAIRDADFHLFTTLMFLPGRISATFQLSDGRTRAIAAVDRWEHDMSEPKSLSSAIAARVATDVGRFGGALHCCGLKALERKPPSTHSAYEAYLLSVRCESDHTLASWREGLKHANTAVELDPGFARGWHMRATFLRGLINFFFDPEMDHEEAFREAMIARRKSLELDPRDPHILAWSTDLYLDRPGNPGVRNALLRAADLGRHQPDTLAYCSITNLTALGDTAKALKLINEALRLCPDPPVWYRLVECRVAYFAEDFARCERAAACQPDSLLSLLFGAMSRAAQNDPNAASRKYSRLVKLYPKFRPSVYAQNAIQDTATKRLFLDEIQRLKIDLFQ
ncbi:winged helix-turn-helix domain-containing protein [Vannielia litorea]|uniref:winged helix-turn-helix domain-containing protein n=1 Tax=Vannielia litorea TaxID=1217970 RepID=UPI001C984B83|nr:winged helix-turn-helix domain-containing protein [Vannielia litorea]MBY6151665.1 winged helix-turn-helix domain-containing protein [Vannielia litorea]